MITVNNETVDRISLINYLINKYNFSTYLEIGVQKGKSFFPIKCKKKIGVDPYLKIDNKEKENGGLKTRITFSITTLT